MIDFKKLTPSIEIKEGKVVYKTVSTEDILATKVDRVVSLDNETPCYMVSQQISDGEICEKWIKNGIEVQDESELTNNKIILPMSQWEEEV